MTPVEAQFANRDGNVALLFALLLPLLLGAVGAGVDYGRYASLRVELQEAADAAAIAGARQYLLSKGDGRLPEEIANHNLRSAVAALDLAGTASHAASSDLTMSSVSTEISYDLEPTFLVGAFKSPIPIRVAATAQAKGSANICVIGLKPSGDDVVHLDDDTRLSGDNCAVHVNSTGSKALVAKANALIAAAHSCTAGGYDGAEINFDPAPLTDCPVRDDPLADRIPPTPPGGCDYTGKAYVEFTGVIAAGNVFCDGLKIDDQSDVTFGAGIHYINGGKFEIVGNSRVTATDASFYFYGDNAEMLIDGDSEVSLSAQRAGPMAGVLIWRAADATGSGQFLIKSGNVNELVGTIYLPSGEFIGEIDAAGDIAEASAYTAIIAETVTLKKRANLVLNSDYKATDVPVPAGIAGAGGNVFLRQ